MVVLINCISFYRVFGSGVMVDPVPRTVFSREYYSPEQYFPWISKALYSPDLTEAGHSNQANGENNPRGEQYSLG